MITKAYSSYFKELAQNNHKEWFHANKSRYENDVKRPFLHLLGEILPQLTNWDQTILFDPKKAIFRINRDIRFSKDKSPYNIIMKAGFSPGGRKSELPGYYLGIDAEHVHVGGGLFTVRPPHLAKVRELIASNPTHLHKIVEKRVFKDAFGRLKGEKAKRLDKRFLPIAEKTELIYHKQFYAFAEFPLANFYRSNGLLGEIIGHFKVVRPLNAYLNKAFQ